MIFLLSEKPIFTLSWTRRYRTKGNGCIVQTCEQDLMLDAFTGKLRDGEGWLVFIPILGGASVAVFALVEASPLCPFLSIGKGYAAGLKPAGSQSWAFRMPSPGTRIPAAFSPCEGRGLQLSCRKDQTKTATTKPCYSPNGRLTSARSPEL